MAPTEMVSPASPETSVTTPDTGLSMSMVALSVITSTRCWSSSTRSPALTCQATISASATPSPTSGMLKVNFDIGSVLEEIVDCLANADRTGEIGPFEAVRIGGVETGQELEIGRAHV